MNSEQIIFYILSFWFIASSLAMIFSRNAAKAVLFLILAFFSAASIWLLLEAEFLAITLILVYVGAVMVLFLFVIKMLNIDKCLTSLRCTRVMAAIIAINNSTAANSNE
jgi:NADH-quinone oxidoreductase subunit J